MYKSWWEPSIVSTVECPLIVGKRLLKIPDYSRKKPTYDKKKWSSERSIQSSERKHISSSRINASRYKIAYRSHWSHLCNYCQELWSQSCREDLSSAIIFTFIINLLGGDSWGSPVGQRVLRAQNPKLSWSLMGERGGGGGVAVGVRTVTLKYTLNCNHML